MSYRLRIVVVVVIVICNSNITVPGPCLCIVGIVCRRIPQGLIYIALNTSIMPNNL